MKEISETVIFLTIMTTLLITTAAAITELKETFVFDMTGILWGILIGTGAITIARASQK